VIWATVTILTIVTAQRLTELWISARNTRKLRAAGALEFGRSHYPLIVALHALWLGTLWWLAPGRRIDPALLFLFALLQLARIWVIATLGPRWTTRIIVLPGAPLVKGGPYRFVRHPNYWIVIAEIAVLPSVFGLVEVAALFSLVNLVILRVRIEEEDRALLKAEPQSQDSLRSKRGHDGTS
jgi:methyltransferase